MFQYIEYEKALVSEEETVTELLTERSESRWR